jgi:hypothetical protein
MLLATLTAPVTPAPTTTRVAAIVQAAVFDAVNGIVQAAYATLVNLYPNQKAKFDQQRALLATMIAPEAGQSVFTRQRRRCAETGRC